MLVGVTPPAGFWGWVVEGIVLSGGGSVVLSGGVVSGVWVVIGGVVRRVGGPVGLSGGIAGIADVSDSGGVQFCKLGWVLGPCGWAVAVVCEAGGWQVLVLG